MNQIIVVSSPPDGLARAYNEALDQLGATPSSGPFTKELEWKRQDFEHSVELAGKAYQFILENYSDRLNRLVTQFLEPVGLTYSIDVSLHYCTCTLRLSVDTIRQVVPVIRLLIAEGLRMVEAQLKSSYTTDKTWRFLPRDLEGEYDYREGHVRLSLIVSAKTCRQVQTGTQTVPVYKTVCDWGEGQQDLPQPSTSDLE